MDNSIDLFIPEHPSPVVAAGTVFVFVDGLLCPDLEPIELIRAGVPEFTWARLRYNPAARMDGSVVPPECIEDRFGLGRRVSLRQLFNASPTRPTIADLPLFAGHIERIETTIGDNGETVEFIARDLSGDLDRITVYGRHIAQNGPFPIFLPSLDTTFNPAGRDNAAVAPVAIAGTTCTAFSADDATGRLWTCAEAIHYLLHAHLAGGCLCTPTLEQLLAMTDGRPVRDLDVTGLSLLDALRRCSESAGLQFRFVPCLDPTGPDQAIVFYRSGSGRRVELNCQRAGDTLSASRTNIASLHGVRSLYPITHRTIGRGDFKVYEATFELVKAWDPALQGTNYHTFCASANPDFHRVRDVYRKWCLNEAGDYTGQPYNQGPPYDFTPLFEGGSYVRRRRRFWPALSTDAQGRSLGYVLQVSFDGVNWWDYLHAFSNLLDECGVWLSSDQLDANTWIAALQGVLRFRITASVVSDERLTCIACDGPVGSTAPVVDRVLTLPRQFRYRRVSPLSVFAGVGEGLGTPDEADDSAALYSLVRSHAAGSAAVIETTEVQTPTLTLHFEPGDRVTSSPDSRDLLGVRRDNRSITWIDRVHIDIANQCTRLKLVRRRVLEA